MAVTRRHLTEHIASGEVYRSGERPAAPRPDYWFQPSYATATYANVMGITKRSILFRFE
jgi:hypothetical protein